MKNFLTVLCGFLLLASCASHRSMQQAVIFDTDMAPDYDDVGAITILHALADSGEAKILATVSSNKFPTTVPCIEVFNTWFGRPDIPVGCVRGKAHSADTWHPGHHWTREIPALYPHKTDSAAQSEDALSLYRRILSQQPDTSVVIVTVGMFTNVANLLKSAPDQYSPLNGVELVRKKVKRLVSMAGTSPEGREFNVYCDAASSQYVVENWPTPIIFSTFGIGEKILTGKRLMESGVKGSPVVDTYSMCLPQDNPEGRMSWDQTAVYVGVRGADAFANKRGRAESLFHLERGLMTIHPDGSDKWVPKSDGPHYSLVFNRPVNEVRDVIENLMMHQPKGK